MNTYDSAVKAVLSSADWLEATIRMEDLASYFARLTGPSGEVAEVDVPGLRKDLADLSFLLDRLEPKFAVVAAANAAGG